MRDLFVANVPDELYRKLKIYCAECDKTVREVIIELLIEKLEKE